ncbi:MAG: hypothetical protein AMS25_08385 [Gemmatimonas sp. SM23_52]|nr:MAG: hypothetical protein AMS25_08385 [Gemmatimonas sp. SM23_52]
MARVVDWLARSPCRSFIIIFLLAFAIRGFFLTKVSHRYIVPHTRWEMEATAFSLAERGEFADPYIIPTGPTAHLPPIMPGILALIWTLFGMGLAAGYAAWLFRIATYSAMYAMLPWLAGKLGVGRQPGVLAGVAGALIAVWPGHGEGLTAIALGLLLIASVRRWTVGHSSWVGSLLLGLAWGVAFHLQPALLTVLLGCVAFELWWSRDRRKWTLSAVMVLGVVLACVPWCWRNYATFHEVFFIRSNLGLELRMGNHEGAAAAMDVMGVPQEPRHPRTHEREALVLREVGEVAYMRAAGCEALGWIRSHPGEFLRLTASRVVHWWCGPLHDPMIALLVTALTLLALAGAWRTLPGLAIPQRAALLIPLATYPLIYYVVAYMGRYRVPLDWILLMFAGAEVWHRIKRR